MKSLAVIILSLCLFSTLGFSQNSLSGKWTIHKVEIVDVMVAENGNATVSAEFLESLPKKDRAFTQGFMEGLGKGMLESEMHFLEKDVLKEINGKTKKETKGTYKFNDKKSEVKVSSAGNSQVMKVKFVDATNITLIKEDPNVGEMEIHLKK